MSYVSTVGCLMCTMVCTRADLSHEASVTTKYMANPCREYLRAVKWIFSYLRGTMKYEIMFERQEDDVSVQGYIDTDYAGDLDDQRFKTCYVSHSQMGLYVGDQWYIHL